MFNRFAGKKDYVTGFVIGVGVSAAGYYLYKKNQNKVDSFLRKQGINLKSSESKNYSSYDLEELVETKEHLEDLIAEKEISQEVTTDIDGE